MPDWTTTRLFMTGPENEIIRFKKQCIHALPDDKIFEETLDFNALVQMPDDVKLTMTEAVIPKDLTPALNWYNRRMKYWGTKRLPSRLFERQVSDDVFDCIFDTAWQCPHPVIEAVAVAFPALKGFVVSYDYSDGTGQIGEFADGTYSVHISRGGVPC